MESFTRVKFTHLDKILYPQLEIPKSQVINYYISVAPKMLHFLAGRPLVRTRFPHGIHKEGFYEKNAPLGTPSWVKTFTRISESTKKPTHYIVCNDVDTLTWLGNLGAIELHIPFSTIHDYEHPDMLLFDLDPTPSATFADAKRAALLLKDVLNDLNLKSYLKTTGRLGLHILIPLVPHYTYDQTRNYVHQIGKFLAKKSGFIISEYSIPKKVGKILVDYRQNSLERTMICPYSLRAEETATVSTPLTWQDLENHLDPEDYNISSIIELDTDPWADFWNNRQELEVNNRA